MILNNKGPREEVPYYFTILEVNSGYLLALQLIYLI